VASVDYIVKGMATLKDTDSLLREISFGMLAVTKNRIHNEGLRADGTAIGQYNDKYLKVREGKFNRTADRQMIFSLTGAMENDYKVIAISDTEYGLGFDNQTDADKSRYLAERFGTNIWALSEEELKQVDSIIQQFVNNAFK